MSTNNPLLADWDTPFGLPPFDLIKDTDFKAAFDAGFSEQDARVSTIASNPNAPTFENTIEALELASPLRSRVGGIFHNLSATDSNPERQAIERDLAPRYAEQHAKIMMNAELFARVDSLQNQRFDLALSDEQIRVLELYHQMFVRSGAQLDTQGKERLRKVSARLAELGTQFTQNLLADEAEWFMKLTEDELSGCPGFVKEAAHSAAKDRDIDGYIITLSRSLIVPFLQFSPNRSLRETAYKAWVARGENGGETDNRKIVAETLKLRQERAQLLGYDTFADFKLATEMAGTPDNVEALLQSVWKPAKAAAEADAKKLTALMAEDGVNGPLEAWDWRFYSEKLRKAEHDLDEAELKPYFQLDQMIEASFDTATRLFGITFRELEVPLYHPDARAWEVLENGQHKAIFIGDYFARSSKRSGAWCSRFRAQSTFDEKTPIVVNVCNFAKAPSGKPSLLTFDDARTLFHEFGHALHCIMSNVTYEFVSCTNVARDFVELPSQLYEHWLSQPDVLTRYARHAETGEPIPTDLLKRLLEAENFDQGFATVEYTASALVDLAFHRMAPPSDPMATQAEILADIGMPHAIRMRHATPHFAHVFSGDGYSSGYYSYMWSEVMDADAFAAFEETGDAFNPDLAAKLADNIYSTGNSKKPEILYTAFRGSMPKVDALLKGRGLDRIE